jgi:hypothetical protein
MASAKTHGLTKEIHQGKEEQKPNVLIYIHNHILKLPLSTQLPLTSVHTENNKLTTTLFSIPESTWRIPK